MSRPLLERVVWAGDGPRFVKAVRDEILSYGEGNPTGTTPVEGM